MIHWIILHTFRTEAMPISWFDYRQYAKNAFLAFLQIISSFCQTLSFLSFISFFLSFFLSFFSFFLFFLSFFLSFSFWCWSLFASLFQKKLISYKENSLFAYFSKNTVATGVWPRNACNTSSPCLTLEPPNPGQWW